MPRPILGTPPSIDIAVPGPSATAPKETVLSGARLQQRLRQKRSRFYLDAISRLDAGTHLRDTAGFNALLAAISAEFPELTMSQRPLGLVSRCYLGVPYLVHICDLTGGIVEHYESGRRMPPPYERARGLALHQDYLAVEVYPDYLRSISHDGTVSVVRNLLEAEL